MTNTPELIIEVLRRPRTANAISMQELLEGIKGVAVEPPNGEPLNLKSEVKSTLLPMILIGEVEFTPDRKYRLSESVKLMRR